MLAGKGINRSGKRMIRDADGSKRASIKKKKIIPPYFLVLKYKSITLMNVDLMLFILEIACLIK